MTLSKLEALLLFPLASALLASGLSEVGCSRDDVGSCPAAAGEEAKASATSSGALLQVLKATSKTTMKSDAAEKEETKIGRQGQHAGGGSRLALDEHISQILKKQGRGRQNYSTAPDVLVELKKLDEMLTTAGESEWVEGHTENNLEFQMHTYDTFAHNAEHGTICETGFNGGHSAVRFLAQSHAVLYEFDLGEHAYAKTAADYLQNRYPGRLHNIWGDSTQTLPAFTAHNSAVKCDILVVDGGHDESVAMADLTNFAAMASVNGHYVAIDDTPCDMFWCKGPGKAWKQLISEGCIEETDAVQDNPHHGFSFGRYTKCPRWPQFTT